MPGRGRGCPRGADLYRDPLPGRCDPEVYEGESLDDARAAVARFLGIDPAELASRRWRGEPDQGDIEAYHESDRELCGGVAIRRVD
jgi:hypothetical protein